MSKRRVLSDFISRHSLLGLWIWLIAFIFWLTYTKYKRESRFFYLQRMLGPSLCISRGTAAVLNLSCALLVLPMCRSITTCLRGQQISKQFFRSLIDKSKGIHTGLAVTVVLASVVHTIAHGVNGFKFSSNFNFEYPEINLATHPGENPVTMLLQTVPGVTGILMVLILTILVCSSIKRVRLNNYKFFRLTHHLSFIFFFLLIIHPMRGVLKEQTNLDVHIPGCEDDEEDAGYRGNEVVIDNCASPPKFALSKSDTWLWVGVPLVLYFGDLFYRILLRSHKAYLVVAMELHSQVIELQLIKKGFPLSISPGQYILLQCPEISTFEWHPFTVTCCPTKSNPTFTIHVRTNGDWTEQLKNHLVSNAKVVGLRNASYNNLLRFTGTLHPISLYVDGPFSSSMEDIFCHKFVICIAGGIGITPFAAMLNYLLVENPKKLQRLHFLWLCRDVKSFLWFAQLLIDVHYKLWEENKPDLFAFQLFLTRCQPIDSVQSVFEDKFPLLERRLHFGRPNWREIFRQWQLEFYRKSVGVFCCGPSTLHRRVSRCCSRYSIGPVRFRFHHESFL